MSCDKSRPFHGHPIGLFSAMVCFCLLSTEAAWSQEATLTAPAKLAGQWMGTLDTGRGKLRLKLVVNSTGKKLEGALYSVDQKNAEIKLDEIKFVKGEIRFRSEKLKINYRGKPNRKLDQIEGTFEQFAAKFPLSFQRVDKNRAEDKHIETWKGVLRAGVVEFDFQLRVFETAEGERLAKLDSFSESLFDLPVDLKKEGNQVVFRLDFSQATYEGKLSKDEKQIQGTWKQRGNVLPLKFESVPLDKTRLPKAKRPQTPQAPFPYESREVRFPHRKAGITLAGTLTLPKGKGPFPALILISGSGPQDRDSSIAGHKPFWVIADALSRRGIAVLRYDERGIGKSTGDFSKATSLDLSLDAESGLDFLKSLKEIDQRQIGLMGHSEGGYIAPMIAARNRHVAFIVSLAGPAVPGKQIVLSQTRLILEASGADPEMVNMTTEFSRGLFQQLKQGQGSPDLMQQMKNRFENQMKGLPENVRKSMGQGAEAQSLSQMTSPWFQFFAHHDPRPDWRKVTCPVLAVNGTLDLQVDAELNLPEIEKALKQARNRNFKIQRFEKLNHLFQKTETGRIDEYSKLTETFNQQALDQIVDWVVKQTSRRK